MHSNSERGGIVGTILLIMGVLVLAAMICTVGAGLYIAHHVRVEAIDSSHGKNVSVETPFGAIHVREDSQADLKRIGVPVYPGAVLDNDHHKLAKVELDFGADESKQLAVVAGEYTTPDPIDKVREYYRGELPHWMISDDHRGRVHISFHEGGYKKIIVLEPAGGGTRIKLASIGAPAVN
jgi:hypothetical protein